MADPKDDNERHIKNLKDANIELDRSILLTQQLKELRDEEYKTLTKIEDKIEKQNELHNLQKKMLSDQLEKQNNIAKILMRQSAFDEKAKKAHKDEIKRLEQEIKLLEKAADLEEERLDTLNDFNFSMKNLLQRMTGISNHAETVLGKFVKAKLASEGMSKALTSRVLVSTIDRMVTQSVMLAQEQENVLSSLNRTTGAMNKFNDAIINVERSNLRFGISTEDAARSAEALFNNLNTFDTLSPSVQQDLIQTTSRLEKFGISAETTAENITTMIRSLQMTTKEASDMQNQMAVLAMDIGLPPAKLAESFTRATPQLVANGNKMISVFQGLAKASKQTGVEINSLIGIFGSQMDTFQSSADVAGKLNAVLGGDMVNSVSLLMATEEERLKMVQEAVKASGKDFASLGKFEKLAIANAAGISDMNEALKIFNPAMNKTAAEMTSGERAAKRLEDRAKDVQPIMEQFGNIFKALAVTMQPIVNMLQWVADRILWVNDALVSINPTVANFAKVGLVALAVGLKLTSGSITALIGRMATFVTSLFTTTAASTTAATQSSVVITKFSSSAASGINTVGQAATKSAPGILALGGAIAFVGLGIGVAAFGLASLVSSFSQLAGAQILGGIVAVGIVMYGFVAAIGALAAVSTVAWAPLLAVGAAIALIGAGIGVAAYGISTLVSSFTQIDSSIVTRFDAIATSLGKIRSIINDIESENLMAIRDIIVPTISSPEIATGATTSRVSNAKIALESSTASNSQNAVNSTQAPSMIPVSIVIDGKVVGQILEPYMNKNIDKKLNTIGGKGKILPSL